jgi:hypothetical protein
MTEPKIITGLQEATEGKAARVTLFRPSLRSIFKRSGGRPVTLEANWQREFLTGLLRRDLVELWYRQFMGTDRNLRGPFLTLSIAGERLASALYTHSAASKAPKDMSAIIPPHSGGKSRELAASRQRVSTPLQ